MNHPSIFILQKCKSFFGAMHKSRRLQTITCLAFRDHYRALQVGSITGLLLCAFCPQRFKTKPVLRVSFSEVPFLILFVFSPKTWFCFRHGTTRPIKALGIKFWYSECINFGNEERSKQTQKNREKCPTFEPMKFHRMSENTMGHTWRIALE